MGSNCVPIHQRTIANAHQWNALLRLIEVNRLGTDHATALLLVNTIKELRRRLKYHKRYVQYVKHIEAEIAEIQSNCVCGACDRDSFGLLKSEEKKQ